VTLTCATDRDAYIATSIVTEIGTESGHVSANSQRVECGPNLAEPREPRFRLIERRDPQRRRR